jgi:hypothetical protein
VLAIAGVAFAVGRTTAPTTPAAAFERGGFAPGGAIARPNGSFDPGAGPNRGFAFDGGLSIDGTITAIDADSVTLRLEDGQEMTFALDDSTTYHEAIDASASDVAVGDDVSISVDRGNGPVDATGGEQPQLSASDVTVTR